MNKRFRNSLTAVIALFALLAVRFPATGQRIALGQGRQYPAISGTVTDSLTKNPIPEASISALRVGDAQSSYKVRTDAAGRFALLNLPAGQYRIEITKNGFLPDHQVIAVKQDTALQMAASTSLYAVAVHLQPSSVISGHVIDQDGEMITGAKVQAIPVAGSTGRHRTATAVTNDLGEYRLHGLTPGQYYVSADPVSSLPIVSRRATDGILTDNYVRTLYPRATDPEGAQPVPLMAGGQASSIDIQLQKAPPRLVKVVDVASAFPEPDKATSSSLRNTSDSSSRPQAELPKSSVLGQVLNAATSEPVPHAQVLLLNQGAGGIPYLADTDSSGVFRMSKIEPGDYRVVARREGFLPGAKASGMPGVVSLKPGAEAANLVLRIEPASVISGRVFDSAGEPASDMRVEAMRLSYAGGRRQLRVSARSTTDDRGQYRLHGLPPGKYYVNASAAQPFVPGPKSGGVNSRLQYISSYYPRAGDVSSAAQVAVGAGDQIGGVDIWTETRSAVTIRGRVLNTGGGHISRQTLVSLIPQDALAGPSLGSNIGSIKDSEGRFEIRDVLPGSYIVSAILSVGRSQHAGSTVVEVHDSDLNNVQLVMNPAVNTTAIIRVSGDEHLDPKRVSVFLEPEDHLAMAGVAGHVRRDGTLSLPNVLPDRYTLRLSGIPERFYIRGVKIGDGTVEGRVIDFTRGVAPLEIRLCAAGGSLTGSVLGEQQQPVNGAKVVLVPNGDNRAFKDLYKVVSTAKGGTFNIVGIAPGEYTLFAWARVEADAYFDPDFLAGVEDLGTRVVVRENSSQAVELGLLATE